MQDNNPCIASALAAWRALRLQSSADSVPAPIAQLLILTTPVPVLVDEADKPTPVGGFDIVDLAQSIGVQPRYWIVDPATDDVESIAWASVLRVLIMSVDRQVGLAAFADAVNHHMPTEMRRALFGHKRLSSPLVGEIFRSSQRAIKSQREALRRQDPAAAPSILSMLLDGRR